MQQVEKAPLHPEPFWIDSQSGVRKMAASRSRTTGQCVFPRLPEQSLAARRFEPATLSAHARLYSFTIIHPNPKAGCKPFALVYADFPEGTRVFGRLVLPENTRPVIGTRLEVVIEPSSDGEEFSYSFIPAPEVTQ
jgi:uncharacterized OB-fold protein